jgi:hypothetical protein
MQPASLKPKTMRGVDKAVVMQASALLAVPHRSGPDATRLARNRSRRPMTPNLPAGRPSSASPAASLVLEARGAVAEGPALRSQTAGFHRLRECLTLVTTLGKLRSYASRSRRTAHGPRRQQTK